MRKENRITCFTNYGCTAEAHFNNSCIVECQSNDLPKQLYNLKTWHLYPGVASLYSIELDNGDIEYDIDVVIDNTEADFYDRFGNRIVVSSKDRCEFCELLDYLETTSLSDFAQAIDGGNDYV